MIFASLLHKSFHFLRKMVMIVLDVRVRVFVFGCKGVSVKLVAYRAAYFTLQRKSVGLPITSRLAGMED